MKLKLVTARQGMGWVREGLKAFFRQPLAFTSLFFFFMAMVSIASQLPVIGGTLALMLLPTMTLALMAATAQAARPLKPPAGSEFMAALRAVRADARPLAVLGLMYALSFMVIMAISALADGGEFARVYLLGEPLTADVAETAGFQAAVWISMALYLPLSLAFWHAPALVHWHGVPPVKSIFFSFVACWRNIGALTLFAIAWLGVFIGVGIGISLVAGMLVAVGSTGGGAVATVGSALMVGGALVMAAMFFSSIWFSFRDSFED